MTNAIKIFLPAIISFIIGLFLTPIATHYFYKYKMWRRVSRNSNISVEKLGEFSKIHDDRAETSTPRTGGMIIWVSVILTVAVVGLTDILIKNNLFNNLYFITRNQTLLPFFTLIVASIIGLGDDFLQIFSKGKWTKDPLVLRYIKIGIILLLGLVIGYWFYFKLGVTELYIPFYGFINLGYLFIPFFILIMLSLWSSSIIDGVDGLAGGVLASIFSTYTLIAFFNNQVNIATFCAVIAGGILAFLWFNIPPARFYMGETGIIGLTVTLSVIAFMTDTVLLLPIIAFPLFITSLSNVVQLASRKLRHGKKVFLFAPLHHHFEALGWSKYKVTMRYWIVGIMTSILGVIIYLIS
jgi:phospho-N-acetylmuramoyl-pentapeptide-transferase